MKERGPGWRLCLRAGEVATERLDAGAWPACTATHFSCCTASAEESGLRPFHAGLGDVGLGRRFSLPRRRICSAVRSSSGTPPSRLPKSTRCCTSCSPKSADRCCRFRLSGVCIRGNHPPLHFTRPLGLPSLSWRFLHFDTRTLRLGRGYVTPGWTDPRAA